MENITTKYKCPHCCHFYTWNSLHIQRIGGHSPYWCTHCASDINDARATAKPDQVNQETYRLIKSNNPFSAIRFGNTEAIAIINLHIGTTLGTGFKQQWLDFGAGVWPTEDLFLQGDFLLSNQLAYQSADIVGFVDQPHIAQFQEIFGPKRFSWARGNWIFLSPTYLRGYCWKLKSPPWTSALSGKRVLVISPFRDSITHQWERRTSIWGEDWNLICPYELVDVVKVPHSPTIEGYNLVFQNKALTNWLQVAYSLIIQCSKYEFDVALIGAGALSPIIATGIKGLGKAAITLNSNLQLHFGISGRRWNLDFPSWIYPLYNKYWLPRPFKSDLPKNANLTPEAAYW